MRVLYVLNDVGGGASLGIYEMLRKLPRNQCLPYALVPRSDDAELGRLGKLFTDVRVVPMPSWQVNREVDWLRRAARALGRWRRGVSPQRAADQVRDAIREWDIDLVHTGTAPTCCGAVAARQAGVAHVWHIKETIGTTGRVQFPLTDPELVRFIGSHSDRVIAMSEFIAGVFRRHGCVNLAVIPDGVDLSRYEAPARELRERLHLRPEEKLVGMVASLSSTWKEHDVFIDMAGQLAGRFAVHFALIGPFPRQGRWPHDLLWKYFLGLRRQAERLECRSRFHFVDFLPDPAAIMASLDLLVHTCGTEPFGRVAIEALAAGVPVVGPATGGIAESIRHEETGLLATPRSSESFAAACARLLQDESLARQLGNAGKICAREMYAIEHHTERLLSLYRTVLDEKTLAKTDPRPVFAARPAGPVS